MCKTRVITAQSIITKVNKSLYVTIGTSSLLKYPAAGISPLQFPWQGYSVFDVSKSGLIPLLSFGVRGVRYRHPFDCPILDCQRHICNRGSFPLVEPVLFCLGFTAFCRTGLIILALEVHSLHLWSILQMRKFERISKILEILIIHYIFFLFF